MQRMLLLGAVILTSTTAIGSARVVSDRSFGGYPCKRTCKPYARGYHWAELGRVTDPRRCQVTGSMAFRAGCMVYTQDPKRGADTDDDGNPI